MRLRSDEVIDLFQLSHDQSVDQLLLVVGEAEK